MEKTNNISYSNDFISSIVFILLFTILFATNPNENDFKIFLQKNLIEKGYKEGEFTGLVTKLIASPTVWAINQTTVRKNYYVLSLYTVTIMGDKYSYIGIMNHFIALEKD